MSDFFEDLGKAVRRMADSVSTEVSLTAQEQRLREAYQELGRLHYEAVQSGQALEGETFTQQLTKISTLLADIRDKRRSQNVTSG